MFVCLFIFGWWVLLILVLVLLVLVLLVFLVLLLSVCLSVSLIFVYFDPVFISKNVPAQNQFFFPRCRHSSRLHHGSGRKNKRVHDGSGQGR